MTRVESDQPNVERKIAKPFSEAPKRLHYRFAVWSSGKLLSREGINNVIVDGGENIPLGGSGLLASKHSHWTDIPILGLAVAQETRRSVSFFAKEKYFDNRPFRYVLNACGAMPVNREDMLPSQYEAPINAIEAGSLVGFFPEGTRKPNTVVQDTKDGLGRIAILTGAVIVPIGIEADLDTFSAYVSIGEGFRARDIIGGNDDEPLTIKQRRVGQKVLKPEIEVRIRQQQAKAEEMALLNQ